jgi:hypothetical protein
MESANEKIHKRISVRTYVDRPIGEGEKKTVIDLLRSHTVGPFGNRMRFELVDFTDLDRSEIKALGTYGVVKGAKHFIVPATGSSDEAMEDLGFCLEKIVLEVTGIGLGTCWMAGTFKRSNFAKRINVRDTEIVPAITPVGYPRDRRAFADRLVRFMAKSHGRKEWRELFFDGSLNSPLDKEDAGKYALPLECVRIAPSASNKQPWRIIRDGEGGSFHFYLKRARAYNRMFKDFNIQNIDMGIAMCHFELSAAETGLVGQWESRKPGLDMGDMEYIVTWVG